MLQPNSDKLSEWWPQALGPYHVIIDVEDDHETYQKSRNYLLGVQSLCAAPQLSISGVEPLADPYLKAVWRSQ